MNIQVFPVGTSPIELMSAEERREFSSGIRVEVDGKEFIAGIEPERLVKWKCRYDCTSSLDRHALFHVAMKEMGVSSSISL